MFKSSELGDELLALKSEMSRLLKTPADVMFDAARSKSEAFAEQIKKYPDSIRSPDSMLKLGQALIAQGQTSGGCTTLGALKTKYPKAAPATLAAAAGARKAACR